MRFIANGVCIRSCRRDEKVQGLHTGIARAFRHNVEEFSIRLGMKFVKDDTVDVKTVLTLGFR